MFGRYRGVLVLEEVGSRRRHGIALAFLQGVLLLFCNHPHAKISVFVDELLRFRSFGFLFSKPLDERLANRLVKSLKQFLIYFHSNNICLTSFILILTAIMSEHIQESKVNEDFGELLAAANLNSAGAPSKVSANFTFDAYKMPKINCFYHKGQTITNFCCSPQCLIPLCPICVPLHAQEHSQDGTFPKLECLELILNDIY